MLIFFPDTNCPSCKTSPPQEGHIHTAHLCERQLPCLKKDHQLSKTLKIPPDSFLKPSTKELHVIHKWGRSSLAKGSANLPWPLQGWCLCVPTNTWARIHTLDSVFWGTPMTKKTRRRGPMGCHWIHRDGDYLSTLICLSLSFFALSLSFSCFSVALLHIYC